MQIFWNIPAKTAGEKTELKKGIAVSQKKKQQTHLKTNRIVSAETKETQKANTSEIEPRKEENARNSETQNQLPPRKKKERKGFFAKMRGWAKKATMAAIAIISCICGSGKKWTKKAAVVTGLAFVGYFGGKFVQNQFSKAE